METSADTQTDITPNVSAKPTPETTSAKYEYNLPVDENHKAKVIKLFTFRRPHMRAFHFAWFSFFLAFFGWFALAPLQKGIRDRPETPWLNEGNFNTQNVIAVAGTLLMRFTIGPVCDRFGPRVSQTTILTIFSLPVFLVGTSQSFWQWALSRFFIGFIGAAFVVTQFWTSIMFSGNIVGTANATSAGWGNMGGGVTNLVMPQIFNGIVKAGVPEDRAWRIAMTVPGCALVLTGIAIFFLTDDLPNGNYADLIREGTKKKVNPFVAMAKAASNWRVWILFLLYAGCFGVELVMTSNLATYFGDRFGLDVGISGVAAGLFGIMNLFARSVGGLFSDGLSKKYGMRGRLWAFFFVQLINGVFFIIFSRITKFAIAIPVLILFSLFVQMAEGCTFGIVPFVDPTATGAVSGVVGAGGNFGAMIGNFLVSSSAEDKGAGAARDFLMLGCVVVGSAFLIPLLWFPQYGSMFFPPKKSAHAEQEDNDTKFEEDFESSGLEQEVQINTA